MENNRYAPLYDEENGYVVSDEEYVVSHGPNKEPVTSTQLHAVLLEMMLEIDRVCRLNDIPYALAFGSALGMYNYHGFIPWDDDMDIVIKYEDVHRLIEAFKKDLKPEYYFDCYENDKNFNPFFPTFKFRKRGTYIKEKYAFWLRNNCKQGDGIFIDIVVMMPVPPKKEQLRIINSMKPRIARSSIKDIFHISNKRLWAKVKRIEKETYEKYKDSDMIGQTPIIPYQGGRKEVDKLQYPKDLIFPFVEYDFCGHKLFSFHDLKGFCEAFYSSRSLRVFKDGKWVDPYPKERREPDHYGFINIHSEAKK